MNARTQFAEEVVTSVTENPVISARAEAARAIDQFLVPACDGNALAGKIVTRAYSVREIADLLEKVRPSPGDLSILRKKVSNLRSLLSQEA